MNSIKNNSKELKNKKTLELINSLFDPYKITSLPGIERTVIIKDHKANVNLLTSILTRLKSKDATQSTASKESVKKEPPMIVKIEIKREVVPIKTEAIDIQAMTDEDKDEVIDINAI